MQSHGSCAARVLILIDIADLASAKNAPNGDLSSECVAAAAPSAARFVDTLRLSVLRVLTQLCEARARDGHRVEWATRFFDSRPAGIGKTPAELKAKLRSRQAAQGTRSFGRVTQASFEAFGDACEAVACGVLGDPLARDRDTALRRWRHGQRKHQAASQALTASSWSEGHTISSKAGTRGRATPSTSTADVEGGTPYEDGAGRMYDGHDTSSHEVVVRSLLEVLQEFGDASESDRTASSHRSLETTKLQLLLHSAIPHSEGDVERFALRGNFTTEAAKVAVQPREVKSIAIQGMLDTHLGKALQGAATRGVSFMWQDIIDRGGPGKLESHSGLEACSTQRKGFLYKYLFAAGGGDSVALGWDRVIGSTGLLPPSTVLRTQPRYGFGSSVVKPTEGRFKVDESLQNGRGAVAVALNDLGIVDVSLRAAALTSCSPATLAQDYSPVEACHLREGETEVPPPRTPWRVMGTVSLGCVWPSCLVDQGWGATVVLRAGDDSRRSIVRWQEFIAQLRAKERVAAVALPRWLFEHDTCQGSGDSEEDCGGASDALTVALLVPVSRDCVVGWDVGHPEAALLGGEDLRLPGLNENLESSTHASSPRSVLQRHPPDIASLSRGLGRENVDQGPVQAELTRRMREAEIRRAMHEATSARRRRRQARGVPVEGIRVVKGAGSAIASAIDRAVWSGGGRSGSARDSESICFTAESTSKDGGVGYNALQWRLEMASGASNGSQSSSSPRGYRLFETAMGVGEEDERTSSSGSSAGPRRALHQALDEASSRSSVLGPDAESSSATSGSKEGSRSSTMGSVASDRLQSAGLMSARSRAQAGVGSRSPSSARATGELSAVFPEKEEQHDAIGGDVGASELPLSFMSESALVCSSWAHATLPAEVLALSERCMQSNATAAAADATRITTATIPTKVTDSAAAIDKHQDLSRSSSQGLGPRLPRARQRYIDAVRSIERENHSTTDTISTGARVDSHRHGAQLLRGADVHGHGAGGRLEGGDKTSCLVGPDGGLGGLSESARGVEERVSRGLRGLQRQYREIVEGGQRSPVEFAVRTVPEAIRDMAHDGEQCTVATLATADEGRHARAAQVLAAIVSGLTSTPEELSAKHKANRGARSVDGVGADGGTAVAKPALQKIRDYQLQALLFCQLHTLVMDLPEAVESLPAFSALAANVHGGSGKSKKKKKKRNKKGKGKGRKLDGGETGEDSTPARPCDPLPDCRRAQLVDYLQPISTMLDARTITSRDPPPVDTGSEYDAHGRNGSEAPKVPPSRAYDGTLADFMGLALVGHFARRLPRTLAALFDDFECHPPDKLASALAEALTSKVDMALDGVGQGVGEERGGDAMDCVPTAVDKPSASAGTSAENVSFGAASTAGILLSDRTAMSHNHFKMSGVLNGFREVKMKTNTTSRRALPNALGRVSGNSGGVEHGKMEAGDDKGRWRRRTTEGSSGGSRAARSRMGRDSKQAAGLAKRSRPQKPAQGSPVAERAHPPSAIRHSPRLIRNKSKVTGVEDSEAPAASQMSGSKRSSMLISSAVSSRGDADVDPSRKRRQLVVPDGGRRKPQSGRRGVFVRETPQKGSVGSASRANGRRGSKLAGRAAQDDGGSSPDAIEGASVSPAAARAGVATAGPSKRLELTSEGGHVPDSPAVSAEYLAAPSPERRRKIVHSSSSELRKMAGRALRAPSPRSSRELSGASCLFVAESPGLSTGVRTGRRSRVWMEGSSEGDGDGMSRQLITESVSPLPKRRAVVPDTPA